MLNEFVTEALIFLGVLTVYCWLTVWEMRRERRLKVRVKGTNVEHWLTECERPKLVRTVLAINLALPIIVGLTMVVFKLKVFAE